MRVARGLPTGAAVDEEAFMYCNGCGQVLGAGQHYCPRCGRTVMAAGNGWNAAGFRPGLPVGWIDRRIHTLAVVWLVYGAVIGIGGLCGLAFAHAAFAAGETGLFWGWHAFGHHGWGHPMPFFFWPFVAVTGLLRVGLALAAGFGLMQRTRWGRVVAIVAGCLALIHVPFGTAIGVWTLFTLLSAPNALAYERMAVR